MQGIRLREKLKDCFHIYMNMYREFKEIVHKAIISKNREILLSNLAYTRILGMEGAL